MAVVPPQYGAGLAHSLSITGGTDFERNAAVDGIAPLPRAKLPSGPQGIGGAVFAGAPSGPPITAKGPAPDSFDVLFEDASFVNNVGFIGGGATLLASTITVRDSQFQSNIGILLGGGMLAGNKYGGPGNLSADIDVENSDFLGNGAYAFGGGFLFGDTTSVSGVEVRGNGSKYISMGPPPIKGAAKGGPLPAVDCGSDTNDAVAGLGMVGSTSASVSGASIFAENCGAGYVGGLLVSSYGGTVSIAGDTQVYANSAAFGGGALVGAKYGANATVGGRFEDNTAAYGAGGLAIQPEYASTVSVVDVTVSGNQAAYGQGGGMLVRSYDANGGAASVVSISGSTVDANASASGGGIAATNQGSGTFNKRGGTGKERLRGLAARLGLAVGAGNRAASAKGDPRPLLDLDVVNSTIDGNSVAIPVPTKAAKGAPGAGFGGGIAVDGTDLGLLFTTVSSNQAEEEGGGLAEVGLVANTIAIRNSVFADNSATASDDVSGSAGADYSLFGDAGFVPASGANNQVGVDALLGPLQDNGGPTFTRLPDASSPAIDSADPAFAPPPDFDQRGTGFPRVIGAAADKGAVEQPPPTPEVVSLVIDPDSFAEDGGSTLTVSLDIAPTADVPVTVAFSGTAVLDTDFASGDDDGVAPGVQVVVPSGSTSGSVALTGLEDAIDEPDEPFTATVTAAVGADLPGAPVSDTGTVLDNDAAPSTTVGLSLQDVPEDGGTTQIILTLSNPSDEDVVITLGFSGEATFGVDYTVEDQDPGTPGIQVIIPAGSTTGSVLLTSIEDGTDENDESVIVSIESVSGGGATGSGTAQGSLIDPAGGGGGGPAPLPQPTIVPTLSPWMLLLLGLILPAAVMRRLGGK